MSKQWKRAEQTSRQTSIRGVNIHNEEGSLVAVVFGYSYGDMIQNVRLVEATNDLLDAAKLAVSVIAEERAGGSIESERLMERAQYLLFDAIKKAHPEYYGLKGE